MTRATSVAQVIAGEAVSGTPEERIADMRAIASVIANRATLLGVTQDSIIAAPTQYGYEFNAYNKALPAGVDDDIVAMAQEAIDYVAENGPVNNATFYATPSAVSGLPDDLSFETETTGHQYFSDPHNRPIGTTTGHKQPNAFAYAANPANVPTPAKNPSAIPTENPAFMAADQLQNVDPNLGLGVVNPFGAGLPDLATAQTFEKAAPGTNPWGGAPMAGVTAKGLFAAVPGLEANATARPMVDLPAEAAAFTTPGLEANAAVRGLPDPATVSSRMGLAEPGFDASRFDGGAVTVASDFDPGRFANPATAAFDPSRFGTPTIDPAANTQSFAAPPAAQASASSLATGLMAQRDAVPPAAIDTSAFDASRFGPEVAGFDQGRFGPEQTADIASSRFSTPAKTSRIGQEPAIDAARMPGLIDPATNTASFNDPIAAKTYDVKATASLGAYPGGAVEAEVPAGIFAAQPSVKAAYTDEPAQAPAVAAIDKQISVPASGIFAANSPLEAQTAVPSLAPTAEQQAAGYQQAASSLRQAGVMNIGQQPPTDLSGDLPTSFDVLGQAQDVVAAPALETIDVPDQPKVTDTPVDIPGPLSRPTVDQEEQSTRITTPAAKTTPQTSAKRGFWDSLVSPQTAIGATVGGLAAGPIGGLFGAIAGQQIAQNPGMFSNEPTQINNIGSGYENVTSIWDGGQPVGTQATASDGQTVTAMPGGSVALTNTSGVTTVFDSSGKASSYFGSGLGGDEDTESSNSGGFFGGLFG